MNKDSNYKSIHEKSMYRFHVLTEISKSIALGNHSKRVWNRAIQDVVELMKADIGSIYLLDNEDTTIYCPYEYPLRKDGKDKKRTIEGSSQTSKLYGTPIMTVLGEGKTLIFDDISPELDYQLNLRNKTSDYHYKSLISAPVFIERKIGGAIVISSNKTCSFDDDDLEMLVMIGSILGIELYNAQLYKGLVESRDSLREAFATLSSLRRKERLRILRELHDGIGQRLTSISLRLKAIQQETDVEVIFDRLNSTRFLINGAFDDLKRILFELKPTELENAYFLQGLREFVEELFFGSGITVIMDIPDDAFQINGNNDFILYRCIQESANNIIKHSKATVSNFNISHDKENIYLTINDNGVGISSESKENRMGITGMRERVEAVQGSFSLDSTVAVGTTISITIPNNAIY